MGSFTPADKIRIAAYGLLIEDRKILLCRLANLERLNGLYTLPGGGLDFGEPPELGVVREIQEETGLKAEVDRLLKIDSFIASYDSGAVHHLQITYLISKWTGELTMEANGTTDHCEWVPLKTAAALPLVSAAKRGVALAKDIVRRGQQRNARRHTK